MKSFRLQAVLDYRKRIEHTVQKSLLICIEKQSLLVAEKQMQQSEILQLCRDLQTIKQKDISMPEMMLFENCIQSKKKCINDINHKLQILDSEINLKKEELIKARQEKRVLEILRKKWRNEEKRQEKRAENVFLDEWVIFGFGEKNEIV